MRITSGGMRNLGRSAVVGFGRMRHRPRHAHSQRSSEPQGHKSRARGRAAAGATAVVVALAVAGPALSLSGGSAEAGAPQKLLQVVKVGLGSDGSLTSVDTTDIAQDQSGYHASDASLEPTAVADQMPIGVSTLYSAGGKVGSDLNDIAGASGPVQVSITVTDQTASPQRLDAAGHSFALVSTPYTVIATAVVPKKSVSQVLTPAQGEQLGQDTGAVTTLPDGDYQIQWAAILAPPALAQSTTFTLGVDATKFQLKSLSISASPGESTDPSLQSLIHQQFGSGSPLLQLENNTVSQIDSVVGQLGVVQTRLQTLRSQLQDQSRTTGGEVTTTLKSSSQSINASITGLLQDLNGLRTNLGTQLSGDSSAERAAIIQTAATIVDQLGVRVRGTKVSGHGTTSTGGVSIYGELASIRGGLHRAALGTGKQIATAQAGLDAAIATVLGSGTEPTGPCADETITCLTHNLTDLSGSIFNEVESHLGAEDAALNSLRVNLSVLGTQLGAVTCSAQGVWGGHGGRSQSPDCADSTTLGTLTSDLSALANPSTGLPRTLSALAQTLPEAYHNLQQMADDATKSDPSGASADAASASSAAQSLSAKVDDVDSALCDLPTGQPTASLESAYASYASAAASAAGVDCGGGQAHNQDGGLGALSAANVAGVSTLVAKLGSLGGVIGSALDLLNPGSGNGGTGDPGELAAFFQSLQGWVGTPGDHGTDTLYGALNNLQDANEKASTISGLLESLDAQLSAIGSPDSLAGLVGGVEPTDCDTATPPASPTPTDSATASPSGSPSASPGAADTVAALFDQACGQFGELDAGVNAAAAEAQVGAGVASAMPSALISNKAIADNSMTGLITELQTDLDDVGQQALDEGTTTLGRASRKLEASSQSQAKAIGTDMTSAIQELDDFVGPTLTTQQGTRKNLQTQLSGVLSRLGSARGTGVLGAMWKGADQIGAQAAAVNDTTVSQSSYAGVRDAERSASLLQAGQLAAGLARVTKATPIGETLPSGASCSVALVFTMGSIG